MICSPPLPSAKNGRPTTPSSDVQQRRRTAAPQAERPADDEHAEVLERVRHRVARDRDRHEGAQVDEDRAGGDQQRMPDPGRCPLAHPERERGSRRSSGPSRWRARASSTGWRRTSSSSGAGGAVGLGESTNRRSRRTGEGPWSGRCCARRVASGTLRWPCAALRAPGVPVVTLAQWAEHWIVAPEVMGSSPIGHPNSLWWARRCGRPSATARPPPPNLSRWRYARGRDRVRYSRSGKGWRLARLGWRISTGSWHSPVVRSGGRPVSSRCSRSPRRLLAYSGYTSQSGRVIDEAALRARGAAADVDRYVRSRHQTLNAIAGAARDRRPGTPPRSSRSSPTSHAASSASTRSTRGSIRTGSSRLAATAPADRRSTSATGRTSRPRSQAGRPSASACSGRSTRHPVIGFIVPTSRGRRDGQRRGRQRHPARPRGCRGRDPPVRGWRRRGRRRPGRPGDRRPAPGRGPRAGRGRLSADRDAGRPGRRRAAVRHGTVRRRRRGARLRPGPERRLARPRAAAGGGGIRSRARGVRAPARR